jgi:hypothetical protein
MNLLELHSVPIHIQIRYLLVCAVHLINVDNFFSKIRKENFLSTCHLLICKFYAPLSFNSVKEKISIKKVYKNISIIKNYIKKVVKLPRHLALGNN